MECHHATWPGGSAQRPEWAEGASQPRAGESEGTLESAGSSPTCITSSLSRHIADPRAAPTDVKIRVLNSTAISLQWNRVYSDTVQGQLREYRVRKPAAGPV